MPRGPSGPRFALSIPLGLTPKEQKIALRVERSCGDGEEEAPVALIRQAVAILLSPSGCEFYASAHCARRLQSNLIVFAEVHSVRPAVESRASMRTAGQDS